MYIAYLIHMEDTPSTRYRILNFKPVLEKEGINVTTIRLSQNPLTRFFQIAKLRHFDVVIIQKKLFSSFWFGLIRKYSRVLVYEFDDCIYLKRKGSEFHVGKGRMDKFNRQIEQSNIVIASTPYLQSQASKYTTDKWKIKIIPNSIDPDKYPVKNLNGTGDKIIIGWIGSKSTIRSLFNVGDQLRQITEMYSNVSVKIVSDVPIDLNIKRLENKIFRQQDEIDDLLSFDISICTYLDDPWNMGKAPVKILTSMACGIPVVALNSTCSRVYIKHHENGLLAQTPQEFIAHLASLIESPKLRKKLSYSARKSVEQIFNLNKVAKGYKAILKEAISLATNSGK